MTKRIPTADLIAMVDDARAATLAFVDGMDGDLLMGPKLATVNPMLWEIGHVAWFQEHFILKQLDGRAPLRLEADALYNSMRVAHDDRWDLPLPALAWTLGYGRQVHDAVLARLQGPLASEVDSYMYRLVTFHEDMHAEAFAYTRQTLGLPLARRCGLTAAQDHAAGPWPGDVLVPGGTFMLGAARDASFVFDNEKWAHEHTSAPFAIARAPVTKAEFARFVEAGGYADRAFWSDEGWAWLRASGVTLPAYWGGAAGRWRLHRFDQVIDFPPNQPAQHVNWHEANAYCAFAGRRLPTELEWEIAATGAPSADGHSLSGVKRLQPWATDGAHLAGPVPCNLDGIAGGPVDVAAHPGGDSAFGCRQMMGNVWEWTLSTFAPYPGFSADAYKEYSQPWFDGTRKVLRGGGWATRSRLVTPIYRNFFPPDRRDIFAGFRTCALS